MSTTKSNSTIRMVTIALKIGRDSIEPLIRRNEDPTFVCGALAYLMGVVIYRAQGRLEPAVNEEGLKAIASLIRHGYESSKEAASHG